MKEILPGVFHWTSLHEGIGAIVHSYWITAVEPAVVIDARVPDEGLKAFERHPPAHAYLTNRHHYRHGDRFEQAFGTQVWCQEDGLHEFTEGQNVRGFRHGDELPGGLLALPVGALCPEETALLVPCEGGALAVGDAVIRENGSLGFVPDSLMGSDAGAVKTGLREAFRAHLNREFATLLFAHGPPLVGGARKALREFLEAGS